MPTCPACGSPMPYPYRFCGVCGAGLAPAAPYAPYGALPRRKDNTTLIVVLVVVALVVLPVAASAILYIMVSGLIDVPPQNPVPVITLTLTNESATGAAILVTGAQPPPTPGNLRVNLEIGTTFGVAASLPSMTGVPVSVSVPGYPSSFTVTWLDVGGDGVVNGGDQFVLSYSTALSTGTAVSFLLIWNDGRTLSTIGWTV